MIVSATKKINFHGIYAFLPVLIVQGELENNRTIKTVHISTGDPLVLKSDAIKYANIWRNESIACGYITKNDPY